MFCLGRRALGGNVSGRGGCLGHEALDKFVSEGLAEIVSFKPKRCGVDNFPRVCVSKLPAILGPL